MFLSILIFDVYLMFGLVLAFWGPNGVVEQLSFSLFISILTFTFDLILGSFLTFWGPNGLFLGVEEKFKNCFGVYSCS